MREKYTQETAELRSALSVVQKELVESSKRNAKQTEAIDDLSTKLRERESLA